MIIRKDVVTGIFIVSSLLVFTGGANFIFYNLLGARASSSDDSNPVRLATTFLFYGISAFYVALHWQRTKVILARNPIVVLMVVLPFVSMIWTADAGLTFRRSFAHLLTIIFCFFVVETQSLNDMLKKYCWAFLIGGVFSFIYTAMSPSDAISAGTWVGAWEGVYGQKNELGKVCAAALVTAWFVRSNGSFERIFTITALSLFPILLLLSQSATNITTVFAVIFFAMASHFLSNSKYSTSIRATVYLGSVFIFGYSLTLGTTQILDAIGRDATFSGRTVLWNAIFSVYDSHFAFLGAGYGAFFSEQAGTRLIAPFIPHWSGVPNHAHNGYIDVYANIGPAGLVLLIGFIFSFFQRIFLKLLNASQREPWVAASCLFFIFLINNITETSTMRNGDFLWILIVSLYIMLGEKKATSNRRDGANFRPSKEIRIRGLNT